MRNADFIYVPYKIPVQSGYVLFEFNGTDVNLSKCDFRVGQTQAHVDGSLKNFTNLYYQAPEKIAFDANVYSRNIHLADFEALLHKKKDKKPGTLTGALAPLNRMLELGTTGVNLQADSVTYRKFQANQVSGNVFLDENEIDLKNITVHHAGGLLKLNGSLTERGEKNALAVTADVTSEDVRELFRSCDDFGLKAITYSNIKGTISAHSNIQARLTENAGIEPGSVTGTVSFDLLQGELLNYEPIEKVGRFVFSHRDLSDVQFGELKDELTIDGNNIEINPMRIESNIITMDIMGVYGFRKGTDINIDIPIRNPRREGLLDYDLVSAIKSLRGLVLHLKAVDDPFGGIKIKWVMKNKQK